MKRTSIALAIISAGAEHLKESTTPCCQGTCTDGKEKFYSVAKSMSGVPHCGECCMNPKNYKLFHFFEKNLTKAKTDSPCADFGYTKYSDTPTHGVWPVTMTFDMYDLPATDYEQEWRNFKTQFGKSYEHADEEKSRFEIFKRAIDHINAENAKGHSYTLALNRLSDLETEEFAGRYMGFKMPDPSQLWSGASYLGNHTWKGEAVPTSIDWTTKGAVTPVKNQGHCGSCWIFSAIGALEGAFQVHRGKLVSLAEQQILDCDHSIFPPTLGCNGGSMGPVFGYAEGHSICTEESYPYQAKGGKCVSSNCKEGIPKGAVTGWKGLAPVGKLIPASMETMMSAVAQQPVAVSIEADKDVFHYYKAGVVKGSCGQMPDHGVLVVGYGTDAKLGDYWKIKNSWGADWGEKGYVRIARGVTWRGECAILNSPSYPVISGTSAEVVV